MTRGARAGGAGALTLLAVAWGAAGHDPSALAHPLALGAVAWATLAVALPAWWVAGATGAPTRRAFLLAGVLAAGQALTHAALSISPLLLQQSTRAHPHGPHGGHVLVVSGAPGADQMASALTHGGAPMLVSHVAAALLAGASWAAAGTLHRAALRVWRLVRWQPVVPTPVHRAPARVLPVVLGSRPAHACAVRGPPLLAA